MHTSCDESTVLLDAFLFVQNKILKLDILINELKELGILKVGEGPQHRILEGQYD